MMKWDDVREIRAFKDDLLTVDRICWRFCPEGDESGLEVHEAMRGFSELRERVESRFGVGDDGWYREVAFPPFVENMTVIWPRRAQKQNSSHEGA